LFLSLLLSGCAKTEEAKKVSLFKKTVEPAEEIEYPSPETFWFGFGLRPGPEEDISIYIPLLKYLESATGRRFRIKLPVSYEDTVEDLGKGVTQFAAIGMPDCLTGEAKYGIRYLVRGVNKPEASKPFPDIIIACNSSVDSRTLGAVRAALLAFEPTGKHKEQFVDWDKTEMPAGFAEVDELAMEKIKDLTIKHGEK